MPARTTAIFSSFGAPTPAASGKDPLDLATLLEAKEVFPVGTIKQYGKKHLYVKTGKPKKPWQYYATLGKEKANAAIAVGGVVVVDNKAVGPATKEMLDKHGMQHPHAGGEIPPLDLKGDSIGTVNPDGSVTMFTGEPEPKPEPPKEPAPAPAKEPEPPKEPEPKPEPEPEPVSEPQKPEKVPFAVSSETLPDWVKKLVTDKSSASAMAAKYGSDYGEQYLLGLGLQTISQKLPAGATKKDIDKAVTTGEFSAAATALNVSPNEVGQLAARLTKGESFETIFKAYMHQLGLTPGGQYGPTPPAPKPETPATFALSDATFPPAWGPELLKDAEALDDKEMASAWGSDWKEQVKLGKALQKIAKKLPAGATKEEWKKTEFSDIGKSLGIGPFDSSALALSAVEGKPWNDLLTFYKASLTALPLPTSVAPAPPSAAPVAPPEPEVPSVTSKEMLQAQHLEKLYGDNVMPLSAYELTKDAEALGEDPSEEALSAMASKWGADWEVSAKTAKFLHAYHAKMASAIGDKKVAMTDVSSEVGWASVGQVASATNTPVAIASELAFGLALGTGFAGNVEAYKELKKAEEEEEAQSLAKKGEPKPLPDQLPPEIISLPKGTFPGPLYNDLKKLSAAEMKLKHGEDWTEQEKLLHGMLAVATALPVFGGKEDIDKAALAGTLDAPAEAMGISVSDTKTLAQNMLFGTPFATLWWMHKHGTEKTSDPTPEPEPLIKPTTVDELPDPKDGLDGATVGKFFHGFSKTAPWVQHMTAFQSGSAEAAEAAMGPFWEKKGKILQTLGVLSQMLPSSFGDKLWAADLYDKEGMAAVLKPYVSTAQYKAMADAIDSTPEAVENLVHMALYGKSFWHLADKVDLPSKETGEEPEPAEKAEFTNSFPPELSAFLFDATFASADEMAAEYGPDWDLKVKATQAMSDLSSVFAQHGVKIGSTATDVFAKVGEDALEKIASDYFLTPATTFSLAKGMLKGASFEQQMKEVHKWEGAAEPEEKKDEKFAASFPTGATEMIADSGALTPSAMADKYGPHWKLKVKGVKAMTALAGKFSLHGIEVGDPGADILKKIGQDKLQQLANAHDLEMLTVLKLAKGMLKGQGFASQVGDMQMWEPPSAPTEPLSAPSAPAPAKEPEPEPEPEPEKPSAPAVPPPALAAPSAFSSILPKDAAEMFTDAAKKTPTEMTLKYGSAWEDEAKTIAFLQELGAVLPKDADAVDWKNAWENGSFEGVAAKYKVKGSAAADLALQAISGDNFSDLRDAYQAHLKASGNAFADVHVDFTGAELEPEPEPEKEKKKKKELLTGLWGESIPLADEPLPVNPFALQGVLPGLNLLLTGAHGVQAQALTSVYEAKKRGAAERYWGPGLSFDNKVKAADAMGTLLQVFPTVPSKVDFKKKFKSEVQGSVPLPMDIAFDVLKQLHKAVEKTGNAKSKAAKMASVMTAHAFANTAKEEQHSVDAGAPVSIGGLRALNLHRLLSNTHWHVDDASVNRDTWGSYWRLKDDYVSASSNAKQRFAKSVGKLLTMFPPGYVPSQAVLKKTYKGSSLEAELGLSPETAREILSQLAKIPGGTQYTGRVRSMNRALAAFLKEHPDTYKDEPTKSGGWDMTNPPDGGPPASQAALATAPELVAKPTVAGSAVKPQKPGGEVPTDAQGMHRVVPSGVPYGEMQVVGSAKELGGIKDKWILKDKRGRKFLFKPAPEGTVRSLAGQSAAAIGQLVLGPGGAVPVAARLTSKGYGSVQPMLANDGPFADPGSGKHANESDFKGLSPQQLSDLQNEHVLDWVLGNSDNKAANFLRLPNDRIIGIDKEQAFKHIGTGKEKLDLTTKLNPSPGVHQRMYSMWKDGKLDLDPHAILPAIRNIERVPDAMWLARAEPYLKALQKESGISSAQIEKKRKAILARKNNVRKDFEAFFSSITGEPFKFAAKQGGLVAPAKKEKADDDTGLPKIPGTPRFFDLTYYKSKSAAGIGGAGHTALYLDEDGNKYIVKEAKEKFGSFAPKPFAALAQVGFSQIAKKVMPHHPAVGVERRKKDGVLLTIHPFVPGSDLTAVSPAKLTATQMLDLAQEHVLDWAMSQHDGYAGNMIKGPGGRLFGIDKEQGFRFFGQDKLSLDYNPNPTGKTYANQFWAEWTKGKVSFNPKAVLSAIRKVQDIPDNEYRDALRPYFESAWGDTQKAKDELEKAMHRKANLGGDFEAFFTDLYQKKSGKKGTFTFHDGWVPADKKNLVTKSKTGQQLLDEIGGKTKAPKAGFGNPATDVRLRVHQSTPLSALQDLAKKLGLEVKATNEGATYNTIVVDKKAFEASKHEWSEDEGQALTPDAPKPITPPPSATSNVPHETIAAIPRFKPVQKNLSELGDIEHDHLSKVGKAYTSDGGAVEGNQLVAARRQDEKGVFYQFRFKLRSEHTKGMHGTGESKDFVFRRGEYDAQKDLLVDGPNLTVKGGQQWSFPATHWEDKGTELYVNAGPAGSHKGSTRGLTIAKVRPQKGESPQDALRRVLDKAKKGLGDVVLSETRPEDEYLARQVKLAWALHPQEAKTVLGANWEKTPSSEAVTAFLASKGLTHEDVEKVQLHEVSPGNFDHVLPGRHKSIPDLRFFYRSVPGVAQLISMLEGGTFASISHLADLGVQTPGSAHQSQLSDIHSGGADYTPFRTAKAGWGGQVGLIIPPDEADRLSMFQHESDKFMCANPLDSTNGSAWRQRQSVEDKIAGFLHTNNEAGFKYSVAMSRVVRLVVSTQSTKASYVQALKDAGHSVVNGLPVEEWVQVKFGSAQDQYDKFIKPLEL
jgi:outer membrane biosynthesis protein TonB